MITYIKGDLFAENHKIIAHGVNCQGVMGSGVAKIIKEKYPWAYTAYKDFCELRDPIYLLGEVRPCWNDEDVLILHCFTQLEYGKDGRRYISYDAVDDCMKRIADNMYWKGVIGPNKICSDPIAMPKIGAGLGGGEWSIIESIINHRLKDHQVIVYEL
jgi:O-acetyl-ADP-ribose deacetylase (regulator of RNase III)